MGILKDMIGTSEGEAAEFVFGNLHSSSERDGQMTARFKIAGLLPEAARATYVKRTGDRLEKLLGAAGLSIDPIPYELEGVPVFQAKISHDALRKFHELEREMDRADAALEEKTPAR